MRLDATLISLITAMNIMANLNYQINSRQLTVFSPLTSELAYDPNKNYLFDLSYLASIRVVGEHAQDFLQGQLSCDLREVTPLQIRQGALCNLKGRVLALLDVVNWASIGFNLIVPADLLLATEATLAKTAMFSRVSLGPATNYQLFGFYLQNPHDDIPFNIELPTSRLSVTSQDSYCCYCLQENVYIFLINNQHSQAIREEFEKKLQWRGSLAWHALQLQHKHIEIYPESRGLFLPHRLGLQLSGYLSFNKGCYRGQEIVARTHYRATLKHELKLFIIQTNEPLKSGLALVSDNDNLTIGELIDFCPIGAEKFLIAVSIIFEHPSTAHFEGQKGVISLQP